MTCTKEIKSIKGKYHFTAHDKKAIKSGLKAGASCFKTARKTYQITETENPLELKVTVSEYRKDDYGRSILHKQVGVITFK